MSRIGYSCCCHKHIHPIQGGGLKELSLWFVCAHWPRLLSKRRECVDRRLHKTKVYVHLASYTLFEEMDNAKYKCDRKELSHMTSI